MFQLIASKVSVCAAFVWRFSRSFSKINWNWSVILPIKRLKRNECSGSDKKRHCILEGINKLIGHMFWYERHFRLRWLIAMRYQTHRTIEPQREFEIDRKKEWRIWKTKWKQFKPAIKRINSNKTAGRIEPVCCSRFQLLSRNSRTYNLKWHARISYASRTFSQHTKRIKKTKKKQRIFLSHCVGFFFSFNLNEERRKN